MNHIAKIELGLYPTPLQELINISHTLGGGKRLFLKREDLCGIGLGGNKVRKMEYLLAEAIEQGCDCIITGGGAKSNQPIAAAACANRVGLPSFLVTPESTCPSISHLAKLLGATLCVVESAKNDAVGKAIRQKAKELQEQGLKPYIIPPGASVVQGVLGYVDAMRELYEQAAAKGVSIDHVICCGATGNTYAGVVLGTKLFSPATTATVVSIARRFCHKSTLCKMIEQAKRLLDTNVCVSEEDLHIYFSCGKGLGMETSKGKAAMQEMAEKEGVFLDPVYTGKAFAGVLDLNREGVFQDGQVIVFLHTGGMAVLMDSVT